ncbi:MAG: DASH complex subunit dam1, partial [Watsoniomyces obsoletus]
MSQQRSTSQSQPLSRARSRSPVSRPTTPLRPSSRSSFRNSQSNGFGGPTELDALSDQFAELSDSMADLEANFMHLQLMHESLSRFGESFASFLYGLNMNAFVVDFPEAPLSDSIKRWQKQQQQKEGLDTSTMMVGVNSGRNDETMIGTGDTSFASLKATPRRKTVGGPTTPGTAAMSTMSKSSVPSS